MKRIYNLLFISALLTGLTVSCNESEDVITGNAKEAGRVQLKAGTSGSLQGAPEAGVELENASIDFSTTLLNYGVEITGPTAVSGGVQSLVVYKSFGGETIEVTSAPATEGISLSLTSISEFTAGLTVDAADLRVGDTFSFYTEMLMGDGRLIRDVEADVAVAISCAADLTGTYLVTNDWCSPSFTVEITQNPDGSYHLTSADGGALSKCTTNSTLANAGNIREQCGVILPSGDLDYGVGGSGNAIGDVAGGTWDAATGTITMEHTQTFTGNWPATWVSTYVRQ